MIVEGTAIQGPVHEAKLKIGDVVKHSNFGNSEGTITRVVFAQNRFWYFIQQPDGLVIEEPEEALVLVSSGPQWQTGPIPEPTGFCLIVLEEDGKDRSGHTILSAIHSYLDKDGTFKWRLAGTYGPEGQLRLPGYTGRWYIQNITLPATSGTGEPSV